MDLPNPLKGALPIQAEVPFRGFRGSSVIGNEVNQSPIQRLDLAYWRLLHFVRSDGQPALLG
jgi:hypothetical protein